MMAVRYDDEYVKQNGQWKFSKMSLTPYFMVPLREGWAQEDRIKMGREMQTQSDIGPQVSVEQASRCAGTTSDRWLVAWHIQNLGRHPLQLLAARLPHSRFHSEERELVPLPHLLPGERARLEFAVACSGLPGTVVENAFVILRVLWREEPWRVFARLRVVFDEQGGPQTTTEVVTVQRVGFSAALKSV